MNITTNHHWRQFLYGYEVPAEIKAEYEENNDVSPEEGQFDDQWIKYGKIYMHLSDFVRTEGGKWQGAFQTTNSGGYVIKVSDDGEGYKIGYTY